MEIELELECPPSASVIIDSYAWTLSCQTLKIVTL